MSLPSRHVHGPRPLAAVLPSVNRAALRARPPAAAMLGTDWDAVVGPVVGRVTAPLKLAAGTLTIGCAGPIALELQHVAVELLARINMFLGGAPIARLRFVQADLPGPPPLPPPPSPHVRLDAATVAVLPEGALGSALTALGESILAANQDRSSC